MEVARALRLSPDSAEISKIFGDNNKNVGKTFAGVEIVHFCVNDAYRTIWDKTGIRQKLGTVVFWQFIVPKVLELMKIVGCEYLFLFAADLSEDEDLVNYYIDNLQFADANEHNAATPMYDFACRFLCQKTCTLEKRRNAFLKILIMTKKWYSRGE